MEWWIVGIILFGSFMAFLATGLPVAFSFGILNTAAIIIFFPGGIKSLNLLFYGGYDSVSSFSFVAVPMFILMGAILMETGLAFKSIQSMELWIGRIPGRLAVTAEVAGVIFGAASGSSMASTATIGKVLIPEMLNQGYARWLTLGSVACTGGIDMLIPPSALVVIFAGIASLPVGPLLIAGVIPGVIMAASLSLFIILISWLKPGVAPPQKDLKVPLMKRLASIKDIAPIAVLIIAVIGSIFFGIATPSESAAAGALTSFILAAAYRKLTFESIKKSLLSAASVTCMTLFIIMASKVFSQVLAFTGVSNGLIGSFAGISKNPLVILFFMNLVVFFLGCFIDQISIMMIITPIFLPLAKALNMELLWWAEIMVVNIGLGLITPPFGLNLFVVRGVTPGSPDLTEVYRGIIPFVLIELGGMTFMILFPALVTWLPGLMY